MIASERKNFILQALEKKGIVSIKELAQEMNIAEITVRRDFEKLESQGLLKRVQGGAIREESLDVAELTMQKKSVVNADLKKLVAEAAAKTVKDGDCVFIDAGTSPSYLIDYLSDKHVMVVTYNELIAQRVSKPILPEIYMLGGRYVPGFSMYSGADTQNAMNKYHFDIAFIGCTSLDFSSNAAYSSDLESNVIKKLAIANSERSILLIDHSKINRKAMLSFASLDVFESIICDSCDIPHLPNNFKTVS